MKGHGFCHCENAQHHTEQEAVGCIHLIDLDDDPPVPRLQGLPGLPRRVHRRHLPGPGKSDLRLAFRVHPVDGPCTPWP